MMEFLPVREYEGDDREEKRREERQEMKKEENKRTKVL